MSNPCASRWGLNTFWHHFWYSDSRYSLYVQQDKLIVELVQLYVQYGTVQHHVFLKRWFWYKTAAQPACLSWDRYYRQATSEGRDASEFYTTKIRLGAPETFHMRVSVLRFGGWILVNLYWFQPDKQHNKLSKRSRLVYNTIPLVELSSSNSHIVKLNSLKKIASSSVNIRSSLYSF